MNYLSEWCDGIDGKYKNEKRATISGDHDFESCEFDNGKIELTKDISGVRSFGVQFDGSIKSDMIWQSVEDVYSKGTDLYVQQYKRQDNPIKITD